MQQWFALIEADLEKRPCAGANWDNSRGRRLSHQLLTVDFKSCHNSRGRNSSGAQIQQGCGVNDNNEQGSLNWSFLSKGDKYENEIFR
jgi:hypothetical protein